MNKKFKVGDKVYWVKCVEWKNECFNNYKNDIGTITESMGNHYTIQYSNGGYHLLDGDELELASNDKYQEALDKTKKLFEDAYYVSPYGAVATTYINVLDNVFGVTVVNIKEETSYKFEYLE